MHVAIHLSIVLADDPIGLKTSAMARAARLVHLAVGGVALVICGVAADVYHKVPM